MNIKCCGGNKNEKYRQSCLWNLRHGWNLEALKSYTRKFTRTYCMFNCVLLFYGYTSWNSFIISYTTRSFLEFFKMIWSWSILTLFFSNLWMMEPFSFLLCPGISQIKVSMSLYNVQHNDTGSIWNESAGLIEVNFKL